MSKAFAAAIVLAVAAALGSVATVFGHAEYDHSTPADGAVLTTAPTRVDAYFAQLMFNQPGSNTLNVIGPQGDDVDNNDSTVDSSNREHMSITLQGNLTSGTYTVQWHTTSDEDGDQADGTFTFTLQLPAPTQPPAPTATLAPGQTPAPIQTPISVVVVNAGSGPVSGGSGTAVTFAIAAIGLAAIAAGTLLRRRRAGS